MFERVLLVPHIEERPSGGGKEIMKLFDDLKAAYKRATALPKHPADLTVDEQWARMERHIQLENMSEQKRLESQYPVGWFRLIGTRGHAELAHWCPKCKQLSTGGKEALHCSGQKREKRPEGWRLLFTQSAPVRFV
jgi:hypothetical protein